LWPVVPRLDAPDSWSSKSDAEPQIDVDTEMEPNRRSTRSMEVQI
jgi:hypothetical protein